MAKTWTFTVPGVKTKRRHGHRRGGKGGYTPVETKAYQELVGWAASTAKLLNPVTPHDVAESIKGTGIHLDGEPVAVFLIVFTPDKRRRDADNVIKILLDGMVGAHILHDDTITIVQSGGWEWGGVDRENPRVEVYVRKLSKRARWSWVKRLLGV